MNNNFFSLQRYLINLGIEAHLFFFSNLPEYFYPSADTFNIKKYKKLIHTLSFKRTLFYGGYKKIIKSGYERIIAAGLHVAFMQREGIDIDMFIPYGSDLYEVCFPNKFPFFSKRRLLYAYLRRFQIKGILRASVVIANLEYEPISLSINKLGLDKDKVLNIGIPMVYWEKDVDEREHEKRWQFLQGKDFIVFNHARQMFRPDAYGVSKGNQEVIHAFAKVVEEGLFRDPILVLFEYGEDIREAKLLVNKLGIEKYVKFMPTMERKYILLGLSKATFATNAFAKTPDVGSVVYEALAVGIPIINNMEGLPTNHKFRTSPIIHAKDRNDIFAVFKDYKVNPLKYKRIGVNSRKWFNKNLGIELAKEYVRILNNL